MKFDGFLGNSAVDLRVEIRDHTIHCLGIEA